VEHLAERDVLAVLIAELRVDRELRAELLVDVDVRRFVRRRRCENFLAALGGSVFNFIKPPFGPRWRFRCRPLVRVREHRLRHHGEYEQSLLDHVD
jgi:hypothetical protein